MVKIFKHYLVNILDKEGNTIHKIKCYDTRIHNGIVECYFGDSYSSEGLFYKLKDGDTVYKDMVNE